MAAHVVIYPDEAGEFRWQLLAANNEIVLPPQGHRDATDTTRALTRAAALLNEALELGAIEIRSHPVNDVEDFT